MAAPASCGVEREPPSRVASESLPWPSGQATSLLVSLQALSSWSPGPTSPALKVDRVTTQPSPPRSDPRAGQLPGPTAHSGSPGWSPTAQRHLGWCRPQLPAAGHRQGRAGDPTAQPGRDCGQLAFAIQVLLPLGLLGGHIQGPPQADQRRGATPWSPTLSPEPPADHGLLPGLPG